MNITLKSFIWIFTLCMLSALASAKSNFVTVKLPYFATIDVPSSWRIITPDGRVSITSRSNKLHSEKGMTPESYGYPFAANYIENNTLAAKISVFFTPEEISRAEAHGVADENIVQELDDIYKESAVNDFAKLKLPLKWIGSKTLKINGNTAIISEYYGTTDADNFWYHYSMVRMYDGEQSFIVIIGYNHDETERLRPISDRIIRSITMR